MRTMSHWKTVPGLVVFILAACAGAPEPVHSPGPSAEYPAPDNSRHVYPRYGVVQSIDLMQLDTGSAWGGTNAIRELGSHFPQTISAVKFTVLMEDRSYVALTQTSNLDIRVGDRVLLDRGVVRRY